MRKSGQKMQILLELNKCVILGTLNKSIELNQWKPLLKKQNIAED